MAPNGRTAGWERDGGRDQYEEVHVRRPDSSGVGSGRARDAAVGASCGHLIGGLLDPADPPKCLQPRYVTGTNTSPVSTSSMAAIVAT